MKIIIFTENNRGGGMDTFIGSLINNWPKKEAPSDFEKFKEKIKG